MRIEQPITPLEYDTNEVLVSLAKIAETPKLTTEFRKVYITSFETIRLSILEHCIKPQAVKLILKLAS